jgi:hypothetical protein
MGRIIPTKAQIEVIIAKETPVSAILNHLKWIVVMW